MKFGTATVPCQQPAKKPFVTLGSIDPKRKASKIHNNPTIIKYTNIFPILQAICFFINKFRLIIASFSFFSTEKKERLTKISIN